MFDACLNPERWFALAVFGLVLLFPGAAAAQDLEPRAYSPSPVGTSFVGLGFSRSSGDISFDPTVPITNAQATLYSPAFGVGQTFGMFGRQALFTALLPYAWGTATGDVGNQQQRLYRSGLADVRARLSVNLLGSPALSVREFAKRTHRSFILGTSLSITAPSGQYGSTKLINIGTNRWSFKPEIGVSYPVKKLDLDLYASGTVLYGGNSNFYTRPVRTDAGGADGDPGPCELHDAAAALGGIRCNVVRRRSRDGGPRDADGEAVQLAIGGDDLDAAEEAAIAEGQLQLGCVGEYWIEVHVCCCGVAVRLVRPAVGRLVG